MGSGAIAIQTVLTERRDRLPGPIASHLESFLDPDDAPGSRMRGARANTTRGSAPSRSRPRADLGSDHTATEPAGGESESVEYLLKLIAPRGA